jgi:dihydroorotate dehydrogenase
MIRRVFDRTGGKYPLIALGGIGCDPRLAPAREVWEYLKLGATMVQIYTGLIYRGPSLVAQINRGLERILSEEGFSNLTDFLESRRSSGGSAVDEA